LVSKLWKVGTCGLSISPLTQSQTQSQLLLGKKCSCWRSSWDTGR